MMNARERIIFALDVSSLREAWEWCARLKGEVGIMKVGMEAFYRFGPEILAAPVSYEFRVMLDLKLHDIPNTVKQAAHSLQEAVKPYCDPLGDIAFVTTHASGGPDMIRAAVEAFPLGANKILAVTALTSLSTEQLQGIYGQAEPALVVSNLAQKAHLGGARNFVCSPNEVKLLRSCWPDAQLVVPGVRYADAGDDQKRVATPYDAVLRGASYLVIGRPIRQASDPVVACGRIAYDIERGLKDRAQEGYSVPQG